MTLLEPQVEAKSLALGTFTDIARDLPHRDIPLGWL